MTDALDEGAGPSPDAMERDRETARLLVVRDPEGLRRLLLDHGGRVRGTLLQEMGTVLDPIDIDAAVNQAAHRVWVNAQSFDRSRGTLRAWFYTMARHCALRTIHERKKQKKGVRYVNDIDAVHSSSAPRKNPEGEEPSPADAKFRRDFLACIDALPRLQKAVLLADLEAGGSAPAKELAQRYGTTPNSIYVTRNNARKVVREKMKELGHE